MSDRIHSHYNNNNSNLNLNTCKVIIKFTLYTYFLKNNLKLTYKHILFTTQKFVYLVM